MSPLPNESVPRPSADAAAKRTAAAASNSSTSGSAATGSSQSGSSVGSTIPRSGTSLGSSRPWTQSQSAAALVVRYLAPMREQLIQWTGSETIADQSLRLLIGHLVTQGFGPHGRGRIRDFLIRGIRSAAKATIAEMPQPDQPTIDFTTWKPDAAEWIGHWRAAILARVWRELERDEHQDLSRPLFSILQTATAHPRETAEMLAVRINTQSDVSVEPATIRKLIGPARQRFAELVWTEVSETLQDRDEASVKAELVEVGLNEPVDKWLKSL